jgi:hypothetical protein
MPEFASAKCSEIFGCSLRVLQKLVQMQHFEAQNTISKIVAAMRICNNLRSVAGHAYAACVLLQA